MLSIQSIISPRYIYLASHIKKLVTGFGERSYSEGGEDMFLRRHFFRGKKKGFYVDVGAFHPMLLSNTYALYKRGWHGINIDANKEAIKFFKMHRRRDINLCVGVGTPGTKEYHRFAFAGGNTFSPKQKQNLDATIWSQYLGSDTIEMVPLRDILEKYATEPIDLLDVDVEGLDLEVLQSNDWIKFRPHIVMVEASEFDAGNPSTSELYNFMYSKHYRLKASFDRTLVFVASR